MAVEHTPGHHTSCSGWQSRAAGKELARAQSACVELCDMGQAEGWVLLELCWLAELGEVVPATPPMDGITTEWPSCVLTHAAAALP